MNKYKSLIDKITDHMSYINDTIHLMYSISADVGYNKGYIEHYIETFDSLVEVLKNEKTLYEDFIYDLYNKNSKQFSFTDVLSNKEINILNSVLPVYFSFCTGIEERVLTNKYKCLRKIVKIKDKIFVLEQPQYGLYPVFIKEG